MALERLRGLRGPWAEWGWTTAGESSNHFWFVFVRDQASRASPQLQTGGETEVDTQRDKTRQGREEKTRKNKRVEEELKEWRVEPHTESR